MPWWVSLYFTALSLILLWGAVDDLKEGRQRGLVAADLLGEGSLIVVGLSYWIKPLADALSEILTPLYIFAVIAFVVAGYLDIRRLLPDPELSKRENIWTAFASVGLAALLSLPALYWGALTISV
jgi:hypothetical protein